jgi:hypothetical protein
MQESEVGNRTKRAFEKAVGDERFFYVVAEGWAGRHGRP